MSVLYLYQISTNPVLATAKCSLQQPYSRRTWCFCKGCCTRELTAVSYSNDRLLTVIEIGYRFSFADGKYLLQECFVVIKVIHSSAKQKLRLKRNLRNNCRLATSLCFIYLSRNLVESIDNNNDSSGKPGMIYAYIYSLLIYHFSKI